MLVTSSLHKVVQLQVNESISIVPRVPLQADKPFKELCLLPMDASILAPTGDYAFKSANGEVLVPSVEGTAPNAQNEPFTSRSQLRTHDGETWLCFSPSPASSYEAYTQVRIKTPKLLSLASIRWYNYEK